MAACWGEAGMKRWGKGGKKDKLGKVSTLEREKMNQIREEKGEGRERVLPHYIR